MTAPMRGLRRRPRRSEVGPVPVPPVDGGKVYRGAEYGRHGVTVEKGAVRTYPLEHVERHSPDGFSWGFCGSGPADLGLAILTDLFDAEVAERHYRDFTAQVIADLPQRTPWRLHEAPIRAWVDFQEGHPV